MSTHTEVAPPIAAPRRTESTLHGDTLVDDYAWLRERDNPEVISYLEAENAYCDAAMEPTVELQKTLYAEMVSHIKETDVSVPFREGEYWYYSRTEEGAQYPIYCRKTGSPEAPDAGAAEQVIVDVNELAKGESFMAIGSTTVSDDGNLLAYSVDNKGFRQYTLQVKDLRTGRLLASESNGWAQSCGPPTIGPSSTASRTRSRSASSSSTGIRWARSTPKIRLYTKRPTSASTWSRTHTRPAIHHPGKLQPHHQRGAVSPGRRTRRRVAAHCASPGRHRVLRRTPGRPLLYPHQRHRPQFSTGHCAG